MSTQQQRGGESEDTAEQLVVSYLKRHPNFFEEHPALLVGIELGHACGPAVSLIERQVQILRRQNRQLREKLMDLVQVARDNDRTNERLHRLVMGLLEAQGPEEAFATLYEMLRGAFGADAVAVRLFGAPADKAALAPNWVAPDDAALAPFAEFIDKGKPVCGRLKAAQLDYLFGDQATTIASAALIPLGSGCTVGMLGVGSRDPERFLRAMGTIYLGRLGELVGQLLRPHLAP